MMTFLEAINHVIAEVGNAPVNDENVNLPSVASAKLRLAEASRAVQKRAYWFNREFDVMLPVNPATDPTDPNKIPVPANATRILAATPRFLLIRNGFAYDPYTQSDQFPANESVCVDLKYEREWEEMPQEAHDCIYLLASAHHVRIQTEDINKHDQIMAAVNHMLQEGAEMEGYDGMANGAVQEAAHVWSG